MKKVLISNHIDGRQFEAKFEHDSLMQSWISECIKSGCWGKAEQRVDVWDNKVLVRTNVIPCEYTITIVDLEADPVFQLAKCYEARKAQYGSVESQLDEIYHDGIESWKARIAQVKLNNPKPEGV